MVARAAWVPAAAHACSGTLLGLGAISGLLVACAALMSVSRPAWWNDDAGARGEHRRTLAGQVDNGAWTLVTQVRPMTARSENGESAGGAGGVGGAGVASLSEPWSVSLSAESATAWLNEKLPRWLVAQGATKLELPVGAEVQAGFEPGVVHLGLRVPEAGGDRFVSLSITPRVDERGLWLPATAASLGRLDVPLSIVLPTKRGAQGGLADVLGGASPALAGGTIRLPDGRRVRLLRLEAVQDHLVLTMRTESRR